MRGLLALLLALLLPAGARAEEEDFAPFRDGLRAAFRSGTAEDRLAAVEAVRTFRNEESTRLLVSVIPEVQRQIEYHLDKREAIRTGKDRSTLGQLPEPHLRSQKKRLDGELKVMEAIEQGLASLTKEKPIEYLGEDVLGRHAHWKAREIAARALGKIGIRGCLGPLARALGDKDPRVRTAILVSLGGMRAEEAFPGILKALSDRDWMVRSATIEALRKIRDPRAFEALLARMRKEKGRLAEDCAEALEDITGQKFGPVADLWERWWAENRERVLAGGSPDSPPEPEKKPEGEGDGYYHGIPVKSSRTIFIVDVSESMSYSATEFDKPKPGEITRLELAKRELLRALESYDPKGTFGLVAFHTVVWIWRPRLVPAKKAMKEDAKEWAADLAPQGTTNMFAALEAAFRMAGMGLTDKYYEPAADTIFLLSDGAPTNEDLTNDDPERVLRAVREWNRLGRMRLNTIGLKGHSADFMSRLAKENGGTYTARE